MLVVQNCEGVFLGYVISVCQEESTKIHWWGGGELQSLNCTTFPAVEERADCPPLRGAWRMAKNPRVCFWVQTHFWYKVLVADNWHMICIMWAEGKWGHRGKKTWKDMAWNLSRKDTAQTCAFSARYLLPVKWQWCSHSLFLGYWDHSLDPKPNLWQYLFWPRMSHFRCISNTSLSSPHSINPFDKLCPELIRYCHFGLEKQLLELHQLPVHIWKGKDVNQSTEDMKWGGGQLFCIFLLVLP